MEWLLIVVLIVLAIGLLFIEIALLPGVNFAGILGFVCLVAAIYFAYSDYGIMVGNGVLLATACVGFVCTFFVLRSKSWKRLALDSEINSTIDSDTKNIQVGDVGIAVGRLAPMGNVQIGDVIIEAESSIGYIDTQSDVEVVKVFKNKIIVKLKQ